MKISDIPLTNKQKEKLISLGFKEEEISTQTLIDFTLYAQAVNGNVSALQTIKKMLNDKEEELKDENVDITKEVKKEEKKIIESLKGLSSTQLQLNAELIHNVAFQSVQLRYLSENIAKNGVKEKYKNGANQYGYKDRTEVKTYNAMIKNYQSCMKQLNDLVIANGIENDGDEFDEFNNN